MSRESRQEHAAQLAARRETERFAAWGRRYIVVLRGRWGLAIDRVFIWVTGYSLITKQYAAATGQRYQPTLMLATIGARTGKRRTVVLPYYRDGERVVLIGSAGGGPKDPKWVGNLRANPHIWIRLRWRWRPVQAHVARDEERQRLWDLFVPDR